MPTDAVAFMRRFYELSVQGDEECWEYWADDAVSVAPPDWPEQGEQHGREQVRKGFEAWRNVFGEGWWEGIGAESVSELPDGRVLVEVTLDFTGDRSGAPVRQDTAAIYTLREDKIVRAEHFMDRAQARALAGLT